MNAKTLAVAAVVVAAGAIIAVKTMRQRPAEAAVAERGTIPSVILVADPREADSVGVGLPMLVLGTAASGLARRLDRSGWRVWVDRCSGAALVALGFYPLWVA